MSDFIKPTDDLPENNDVQGWLKKQLNASRPFLLAFADDGVIWGRLGANNNLQLAPHSPALRADTLQQAFVFGKNDEVRLFRDELRDWKAKRIMDVNDADNMIVESQILWGNKSEGNSQKGFAELSEYRNGIPNQFLPIDRAIGNEECVRLEIHHMVEYNKETGEARIAISRLAGLTIGSRALEVA